MEKQNTQWKQANKGYQYIQGVGTCMAIYAQDGTGIVAFVFQKDGQDNAPLIANAPETRNKLDALERRFAFLQDQVQELTDGHTHLKKERDNMEIERNQNAALAKAYADEAQTAKKHMLRVVDERDRLDLQVAGLQMANDALRGERDEAIQTLAACEETMKANYGQVVAERDQMRTQIKTLSTTLKTLKQVAATAYDSTKSSPNWQDYHTSGKTHETELAEAVEAAQEVLRGLVVVDGGQDEVERLKQENAELVEALSELTDAVDDPQFGNPGWRHPALVKACAVLNRRPEVEADPILPT